MKTTSWTDLQEKLFVDSWSPQLRRFRSPYAYRGVSDSSYVLTTSLMRLGGEFDKLERHLLRNFRKYARRSVVEDDSIWHWVALAQHHGLPTRLLDWTFSPYVALHFATSDLSSFDRDGAIWTVDFKKAHERIPAHLKKRLDEEGSDVFTTEMLAEAVNSLEELGDMQPSEFILFFDPPSLDERIVNQSSLLSVVSQPGLVLNDWLEQHPDLWHKIIIPAELKWEVRDKLDQANITERVLFPGLDGLSKWLKRQYSPRES
jgi:hypothetical protein